MRRGIKAVLAIAMTCGCMLAASAVAAAAPPNDEFANRTELIGPLPIEAVGSTVEATPDPGQASWIVGNFAAGHSIWFKWTAPESRYFSVGACDSEIRAVVGIFTGTTLGSLTRVAQGNASEGPHCPFTGSEYTFKASAGIEYVIGLDGNGFYLPPSPPPVTEGPLKLRIEATPVPANDSFAAATPIEGEIDEEPGGHRVYMVQRSGFNWNATKEVDEPDHAGDPGGASVWYRWTAPESGIVHIGICCSLQTPVGVYAGDALSALTPVASGAGGAEFATLAGETYRIAVDGKRDSSSGEAAMGGFSIQIAMSNLTAGPGAPKVESGASSATPFLRAAEPGSLTVTITKVRVGRTARTATVAFRSDEPGTAFTCKLDRRKRRPCTSPATYRRLSPGLHSFEVSGASAAGNAGAAAAERFRVPAPKHRHR